MFAAAYLRSCKFCDSDATYESFTYTSCDDKSSLAKQLPLTFTEPEDKRPKAPGRTRALQQKKHNKYLDTVRRAINKISGLFQLTKLRLRRSAGFVIAASLPVKWSSSLCDYLMKTTPADRQYDGWDGRIDLETIASNNTN